MPGIQPVKKIKMKYTKSAADLLGIVMDYMADAAKAYEDPGRRTAWITAGFPVELTWALDVFCLMPENSAIVAALQGRSLEMIEHMESEGFCRDLCSYMKTGMGSFRKGLSMPEGGILKPDCMLATNTICDTHWKWFEIESRRIGVPYFCYDVPSFVSGCDEGRMQDYVDYTEEQTYSYLDFMEKNFGIRLDDKKLASTFENSARMTDLWEEIMDLRRRIPSPYLIQETINALFPLAILIGLEHSVTLFGKIRDELKERVNLGEGAIPAGEEKYRLIWEGIPIWHRTKLYNELLQYGAVVTYEPYTESFGVKRKVMPTVREQIREIAKAFIHLPYNYNLETRIPYFENLIDRYSIDGVILHHNMSCRPSAASMMDLKNAIQKSKGIPVLLFDCDQADPRAYSDGQVKTRMEGFIELMEGNRNCIERA
jgi:benzoyl-CoA reductase/2-hydroxyglutaryl-CoA dehydratase subunit BcrC/BadD/HgdB